MAEDVNRPDPDSPDDPGTDPSLLPDARRRRDDPEAQSPEPETLPEVRSEQADGALDRPLTGGLVGLAIGAIVAATVALFAPGFQPGPAWSPWKPSQSGTAGANQIARHVARGYRLPTGDQMVLVTAGPPRVGDLLPAKVAVAGGGAGGQTSV